MALVKLLLKSIKKTLTLDVNVGPVAQMRQYLVGGLRKHVEGMIELIQERPLKFGLVSQAWTRTDEQIALLTRVATESGLRRVPTKAGRVWLDGATYHISDVQKQP